MGQHFHTGVPFGVDPIEHWGEVRMARHLKNEHGFIAPMAWGVGQLQLAHLDIHQNPGPNTPPEEAPMPEPIQTCGAINPDVVDAVLICQYPAKHGPLVNPGGPIQLTGTFDHGDPSKAIWWVNDEETQARHLWMESTDSRVPSNWDELQQETRDYWRSQVRLRQEKTQVSDVSTDTDPHAEGKRIMAIDRIICTMAGISFDTVWALDESISLRGVMRATYGTQATRVHTALGLGGQGFHEVIDQAVAQERALVEDMEETNNRLRGREAALEAEVRGLQDTLEEVRDERDRAQQALLEKLTEASVVRDRAETLLTERDQLQQANTQQMHRIHERERQLAEAHQRAETLMAERDNLSRAVADARRALATGRERLRSFIRELRQLTEYQEMPVHSVADQLDGILTEAVSTETPAPGIQCTEAHLGLATTRSLLDELRARIETDVAGKGLDYRTVDFP